MSFNTYKNVVKMITLPYYRGLVIDNTLLQKKEFYNTIHMDKFVLVKCRNPKIISSDTKNKDTIGFYITHSEAGITRTVSEFKKVMNKVPKGIRDVYMISNKDFSQQVYNTIGLLFSNYNVMKLDSTIFEFEVPKHVLVSKHEILNEVEYKTVQRNLSLITPLNLSKIRMDDAQCIWIGAKPKDIIRITRLAYNGESINYRVVVGPVSLKVKSDYDPSFIDPNLSRLGPNGKTIITKESIQRQKEEKIQKSLAKKAQPRLKKKIQKKKTPAQ